MYKLKNRNGRLNEEAGVLVLVSVILFIIIGVAFFTWVCFLSVQVSYANDVYVKEKVGAHGSDGEYLVYTPDEVFTIADNPLMGVWDASDTYNGIEEGQYYNFKTTGIRNHFLSWYRNIISYEKVSK